jgi:outer membrane lipoprotein-sorting protein
MKRPLMAVVLLVASSALVPAQSATPTADGLELLKAVSQHYADAKSYHIEEVEERQSDGELQRSWQKTILVAAEAPGGRFRYEGHAGFGSALSVSDGKMVSTYHIDEHRYTVRPASEAPGPAGPIGMEEMALTQAKGLREQLAGYASHLKSASRLPDAALSINGRDVPCYVVRVATADMKRTQADFSFVKTLWIDKASGTIVKTAEQSDSYVLIGTAHIPTKDETTTTYPVVQLSDVSAELFVFTPPPDAKLIPEFLDPMKQYGPDISGQMAPALKLKSADGTLVSLDSYRGKPVLLDVWATWCPPCVCGPVATCQSSRRDQRQGLGDFDRGSGRGSENCH